MMASDMKVRNGARLVYEIHGRDSGGQRMVLIHSLGMDRFFWTPVIERLANEAVILVYDCLGHGQSDKPEGPYRVESFAADLADLLDHIGWSSAVIAGASMGGCILLAFAAAYPARARALGLIDTTAWYNAPDKWEERAAKAESTGLKDMIDFQVTRWFTDRFRADHPDIVTKNVDVLLANDPAAYARTCRMLGACNLTTSLSRLKLPVRIVVGAEDYATPIAMAETLHRGIAGSILTILDGARHLTPQETPERIAAELKHLLDRFTGFNGGIKQGGSQ